MPMPCVGEAYMEPLTLKKLIIHDVLKINISINDNVYYEYIWDIL